MLFELVLLAPLLSATSSAFVSKNNLPAFQLYNAPKPLFQTSINEDGDLYLYSFDSALASMVEYKSKIAIQAAIRVWPSLLSVVDELGMKPYDNADSGDDYLWLIQKLGALSSLTQQGDRPDEMLGCDEVLLTRMLLEEQLLDDGRSNGRGGKYGGKFHPGKRTGKQMGEKKNKNNVGSRPLTVGEIYANWSELRYVTHNKYPFLKEDQDGKVTMHDPLPEIRRVLCKLHSQTEPESGKIWHPFALDILRNRNSNNVVLLGNEAILCLALNSLTQLLGDTAHVTVTNSTTIWSEIKHQQTEDKHSLLLLVPDSAIEETQSALMRQIIFNAASDEDSTNRNIYVAHGSIDVLKKCKSFLGEDPPLLSNGLRRCAISIGNSKTSATLFLPSWTKNVHPTQLNDAAMDPWLNVASEELFEELASAVII